MTDQSPSSGAGKSRPRIPPLLWIVIAALVAWMVVAMVQRQGTDRTPQGGTMPAQAEGASIMPAAPAGPGAPATPGGVVNGPAQPAP
jgi:hypothetical protein